MERPILRIPCLVILLLPFSCNTNPGGSQTVPDSLTPTTTFSRIDQPGDFVSWDMTLQQTFGDSPGILLAGTATRTVLAETVVDAVGNEAKVSSLTVTLTDIFGGSVSTTGLSYFTQDDDGTSYDHGGLDAQQPAVERFVIVPTTGGAGGIQNPLRVGATSLTNFIEYDDGTTETRSSTVVAIEEITVPLGTFVAFRIEGSSTEVLENTTTTFLSTKWSVPEIGVSVRGELSITIRTDGELISSFSSVLEATQTNIPFTTSTPLEDDIVVVIPQPAECSYASQAERDNLIDIVEAAQQIGDSKSQAFEALVNACQISECFDCVSAIVDLVYGN